MVIGVAGAGAVIAQAALLADIISQAVLDHAPLSQVSADLGGLAAAFAARALLAWAGEVTSQRISADVTSELRRRLLRHALDLGPSWLASERSGELSLTATRGIRVLGTYLGRYLPQALLAALVPLVIVAWVAGTDWPSALILIALVASVPPTMVVFGRRASEETRRQWRRLSSLAGRFLELVQGLPTLRAFGRAARGRDEVAAATSSLRQATVRTLRTAFLSSLALDMLAGLGVGLVAMVLGLRLLDGSVHLSLALAVLLVAPEVFVPLRRAAAEFHANAEGKEAAARILDVLDTPPAPSATPPAPSATPLAPSLPPGPRCSTAPGPRSSTAPDPRRSTLRMAAVRVRYPSRVAPALDGFSLELAPREHLALRGASGSGKSTVLAVLLRFVPWETGAVSVDGVDLASLSPTEWRRHISWVPERPHVFSGTLADNVRLGGGAADDEAVRAALASAGLDQLLSRLPRGLETAVGEGGIGLSAGERKRVGLARAILRNAPLVLLDEPCAHLDREDVAELRPHIEPWIQDKTLLAAGHTLDLLPRFDREIRLHAAGALHSDDTRADDTRDDGRRDDGARADALHSDGAPAGAGTASIPTDAEARR